MANLRDAQTTDDWKMPDDDEEIAQLMEDFKWSDADTLKYIDDPADQQAVEFPSKEE